MANRDYTSPVRDEAKRQTRERILDALVRVVIDDGVHAFTVANVAKRAGVSHRTVYRHFATREELLEGLADSIDALAPSSAVRDFFDLETMHRLVPDMIHGLNSIRDQAAAEFITIVALQHNTKGKQQRWAELQAAIAERFPALSDDQALEGALALRALLGAASWFQLCVLLELPAGPVATGLAHAAELVVADLAAKNNAQSRSDSHD